HEGRRVHLCTICGWPFSNPHPSAKHRRSHKKRCGTIEGYTVLIGVEAVSDEDHHADTDKEKSPNDVVTESSDSGTSQGGSAKKTLDKDLFYSFNDGENGGTNEVLNDLEVTEKLELTETDGKCADGLVKDGAENVEESLTSEIINEEAKDSDVTKTTPDVSLIVGQDDDNIKQEICEKIESGAVKESEVNNDKIELDHEVAPEVIKESEIQPTVEGIVDEIKIEKIESDRELVPEEVSETDKKNAVTEFSDRGTSQGGSVKESLDKDLFYSFSNGENGEAKMSTSLKDLLGEAKSPSVKKTDHAAKKDEAVNDKEGIEDGTNEVLNAPIEVSKVDASLEVTEKLVTDPASQEAETIEAVKAAEEKVEVNDDNIKQDACEKIESEAVKESEVNND
ncbi:putative transcription factor C2H2 family protein, partial [Tanacetum coccineum]